MPVHAKANDTKLRSLIKFNKLPARGSYANDAAPQSHISFKIMNFSICLRKCEFERMVLTVLYVFQTFGGVILNSDLLLVKQSDFDVFQKPQSFVCLRI